MMGMLRDARKREVLKKRENDRTTAKKGKRREKEIWHKEQE